MTDYTNKQVMKKVVREAEDVGIFATGKNKKRTKTTYTLILNEENAMILEMIKKEKSYGYKLVQIDFEMGLSSLEKPLRISIKKIGEKMFKKNVYEIETIEDKDDASRAWSGVSGEVRTLYFKSKSGFIEQINTTRGKR
jgi:ACT domain-containing protein